MVTSLKRMFKSDWIQALNVEGFLDHFNQESMDTVVQEKWVDTKNHFIFMTNPQMIQKLKENPKTLYVDCSHKVINIINSPNESLAAPSFPKLDCRLYNNHSKIGSFQITSYLFIGLDKKDSMS